MTMVSVTPREPACSCRRLPRKLAGIPPERLYPGVFREPGLCRLPAPGAGAGKAVLSAVGPGACRRGVRCRSGDWRFICTAGPAGMRVRHAAAAICHGADGLPPTSPCCRRTGGPLRCTGGSALRCAGGSKCCGKACGNWSCILEKSDD